MFHLITALSAYKNATLLRDIFHAHYSKMRNIKATSLYFTLALNALRMYND